MFLKFLKPRTGEKQRLIESLTRDKDRLDGECEEILAHIKFLQEQHRERTNARFAIAAALSALTPEDRSIGAQAHAALEAEFELIDFSTDGVVGEVHASRHSHPLRGVTAALGCFLALFVAQPADAAGDFETGAVAALIAKEYCPGFKMSDEKLGSWIYLAAAEMGQPNIDAASMSLAASAIVRANQMQETGQLSDFCKSIIRIVSE